MVDVRNCVCLMVQHLCANVRMGKLSMAQSVKVNGIYLLWKYKFSFVIIYNRSSWDFSTCIYNNVCHSWFVHNIYTVTVAIVDFDSFLAFSKVTGIETIHMFFTNRTGGVNNTMNSPTPPIENPGMKNVIGLAFDYEKKRQVLKWKNPCAIFLQIVEPPQKLVYAPGV